MEKKKLIKYNILAIALAIFCFFSGIFLGDALQEENLDSGQQVLSEVETKFNSLETSMVLMGMDSDVACQYYNSKLNEIDDKLSELKPTVVSMERDVSMNTKSYKELKKRFISLRLKYWVLNEKFRETCNENVTTILYFYVTEEECRDCQQQGTVLSYIQEETVGKDKLVVAPVDMDEDLMMIDIIVETYNITDAPFMLLDGQKVYRGLTEKEEIYDYLCNEKNLTLNICNGLNQSA